MLTCVGLDPDQTLQKYKKLIKAPSQQTIFKLYGYLLTTNLSVFSGINYKKANINTAFFESSKFCQLLQIFVDHDVFPIRKVRLSS